MRDFSVKVFDAQGKLKSEIVGTEGRHYPDTDTLEIDQIRIRAYNAEGRLTTAQSGRGLINADGSEAQLFDKAVVVREAIQTTQGIMLPRSELRSEFLHLYANTETVRTHLPVELIRGGRDRFTAERMTYDNLDRTLQLSGRVRGSLAARQQ